MNMIRSTKGITLIALIITIIVLLILAGVTISTLAGENGLISRANNAKIQTEIASIKEEIQTKILENQAENNGNISNDKLNEIIANYDKDNKIRQDKEEPYIITKKGYEIKVSDILKGIIKEENLIESIEVTPREGIVQVGERKTLTVKVLPNNATNKKIAWEINEDNDIFLIENSEEIRDGEYEITVLGKKTGNGTINFYEETQDSTSNILLSYNLEVKPIVFENVIVGYDNGSSSSTFTHGVKVLSTTINTNELRDIINYSEGKFNVLKKCIISFTGTAMSTTPDTVTMFGYYKNNPLPSGVDNSTYINWEGSFETRKDSFEDVRIPLEEGEYFYVVWKSMSNTMGCAGEDYKGEVSISIDVIVNEW